MQRFIVNKTRFLLPLGFGVYRVKDIPSSCMILKWDTFEKRTYSRTTNLQSRQKCRMLASLQEIYSYLYKQYLTDIYQRNIFWTEIKRECWNTESAKKNLYNTEIPSVKMCIHILAGPVYRIPDIDPQFLTELKMIKKRR
jgi:hypothetical protein